MASTGRKGILFGLCGPAGVGKTVLGQRLLVTLAGTLDRSVSTTTRKPRLNEKDGDAYFFVSEEEFKCRADQGDFFECELVHGSYYGTLRSTLQNAVDMGKDLMLIIDIKGCLNIKRHFPLNSVVIFVAPPSQQALVDRMRGRGVISDTELSRRLETARMEYKTLLDSVGLVDYLVMNDDVQMASNRLCSIVVAERCNLERVGMGEISRLCSGG